MKEYVYQYKVAITWPKYKYIGGVIIILVSQLALWRKKCLIIE